MAIRIKARAGESAEQMLRRFKKLCEKEGLTKEMKKRQYYEKPSEKKRRAAIRAARPPMEMIPTRSGSAGAGGRESGGRGGAVGARAGSAGRSSGGRTGGGRPSAGGRSRPM